MQINSLVYLNNLPFELMIVNEFIQDTINNNNELWILSQDIGKAYDCANISQLRKAMDRIKIPTDFSNLILGLFKDRKNEVITAAYGKTLTNNIKTFNFNYIKDEMFY